MKKANAKNKAIKIAKRKLAGLLACVALLIAVFGSDTVQPVHAAVKLTSNVIKNAAESQVGNSFQNGMCLRFVEQVYEGLGVKRPHVCCAYKSGSRYIVSSGSGNIPIGATVYFGNCAKGPCRSCGAAYYGHVGIYVGDGYFVHATDGKVQKTKLSSWSNKYRGYGYSGNFVIENNGGTLDQNPQLELNQNNKPAINDVNISNITSSSIKFNFSTNEVTQLVRVVYINAANNWQSTEDYHSAQSKIYTINRCFDTSAGNRFYIRIYAYAKESGNYVNETLHALTYGSSIGMVQLPIEQVEVIKYEEYMPKATWIGSDYMCGWTAVKGAKIERFSALLNGQEFRVPKVDRPDVVKAYPGYSCYEYNWSISMAYLVNGSNPFTIRVHLSNGETREIASGVIQANKVELFDAKYFYNKYASTDSRVRSIGLGNPKELERYWYSAGIVYGMDPSAAFSFSSYKKHNTDVVNVFGNTNIALFNHMIQYTLSGSGEYRRLNENFDLNTYKLKNKDLSNMTPRQLVEHYVKWGYYEGRIAI